MALLIVYDDAVSIQKQTVKRLFLLKGSEEKERLAGFPQFLVLLGKMVRGE